MNRILVINPGSTSTKVAYFEDAKRIADETIDHERKIIDQFDSVASQLSYRYELIKRWMCCNGIRLETLNAVAARGGMLRPVEGGSVEISDAMVEDLRSAKYGEHASNLGAMLAKKIVGNHKEILCIISDPTCTDELNDYARISGHPLLPNISKYHALNQKFVARKIAARQGIPYEEANMIVAHMGGGISVGIHQKGKVVHVNNGLDGTGPYSPERAGTLPRFQLIDLCFSGRYTKEKIKKMLNQNGGMVAYLGTNDLRVVEKKALAGDAQCKLYLDGMCYQVAREISAGGAVLKGNCDAIILTGGIAYSEYVVAQISERVSYLAPVIVSPGSDENLALAQAALRVLQGKETAKSYDYPANHECKTV